MNTVNYNLEKLPHGYQNYDVPINENFEKIDTEIKNRANEIGTLANLSTTNKTSTVNAVNEIVNEIGVLSTLETTNKDNIVNCINEVNTHLADKVNLGHTDHSGSNPMVEIGVLGSASAMHLLAGEGNTTPYVLGIGVDHGTTSGIVASVKDQGIGLAATLEATANGTPRGFFGQVFSPVGKLVDLVQGVGSGDPMMNLRNPYGGTRDMSKIEAGSYNERVTADGTKISWYGDETLPNYYTLERLTGAKWDKVILAKANSTQFFGTRLYKNANHFKIQQTLLTITGSALAITDVDNATWSTLLDLQDTNLIGFFGATPSTRRPAISDATDSTDAVAKFNTLKAGLTSLGLFY